MPFKSKAQQRWMFANEPAMAKRWADHTPSFKSLPARAGKGKKKKKSRTKRGFDMEVVARLAQEAATVDAVEKLAADTQISPELVTHLARTIGMTPSQFVKQAYADPKDYTLFLKVASGAVKTAGYGGMLTSMLASRMKDAGKAVGGAIKANPRRTAAVGLGAGGVGMAAHGLNKATQTAVNPPAPPEPPAAPKPPETGPQGGGPGHSVKPGGGGMSPAAKAMAAVGGVGLGALGVGAGLRARNKKKQQKTAADVFDAARRLVARVVGPQLRKEAADKLCSYLDVVAKAMPLEKTASVRTVQAQVASGKSLSHAIKLAYPQLQGEQRGILAATLVRKAHAHHVKLAASYGGTGVKPPAKKKTVGRTEMTVKMKDAPAAMSKMGGEKTASFMKLLSQAMKNPKPALGMLGAGAAGVGAASMAGKAMKTPTQPMQNPMNKLQNSLKMPAMR